MDTIYIASISASNCNYEFWIDDFRADLQMGDQSTVYELPINQWLQKKNTSLSLTLKPLSRDTSLSAASYCNIIFFACTVNASGHIQSRNVIKEMKVDYLDQELQKTGGILPGYSVKDSLSLEAFNDDPIPLQPLSVDFGQVEKLYKEVAELIKDRRINELMAMMETKTGHFAKRYHVAVSQENNRRRLIWEDLMEKNLEPLLFEGCRIKYYNDRKMVCLENADGDQPLYFTDDIDVAHVYYPLFFGKVKGANEWKIVL